MTHRIATLLVAIAAGLLLAACSDDAARTASGSPNSETASSGSSARDDKVFDMNGTLHPFEELYSECDPTASQEEQVKCMNEVMEGRLASFDGIFEGFQGSAGEREFASFEKDGTSGFTVRCPPGHADCHALKEGDPIHAVVKVTTISGSLGYEAVSIKVKSDTGR